MNCLFKINNKVSTDCPKGCGELQGQCLCRRNTKDDCETEKHCYWLVVTQAVGRCIHQTERSYGALFEKLNNFAIEIFYNSRPGKVNLPNGIYGPHTIGKAEEPKLDDISFKKRPEVEELATIPTNPAFSLSLNVVASLFSPIYLRQEFGVAFTAEGEMWAFVNECLGAKNDIAIEFQIVLGLWQDLANISVDSYGIGAGFDAGGVGYGGETGALSKIKWSGGDPIGAEFGVGTGIEPWSSGIQSVLSKAFGLPEPLSLPYLPSNYEISGEKCSHRMSFRI